MTSQTDALAIEPAGPPAEPRLATRAIPPSPRRLSRNVLAISAGVSAVALATALGFGLSSSHHGKGDPQPVAVDNRQMSDALSTAPKDYGAAQLAEASKLPPPTAAPITEGAPTRANVSPAAHQDAAAKSAAAARQRRQRQDSAHTSKLFATDADRPAASRSSSTDATSPTAAPGASVAQVSASPDAQDRKSAFVAGPGSTATVNSGHLTAATSKYVVLAGSTIAAALVTGLSSDLPGEIVAQVTEDVFDSVSGRARLIPQGARLIGSYDAHVSFGQSRALVVWTRLILPDGQSIDLDRLKGTDGGGQSGFADRVDHHTGTLLKAGMLSTLFGLGGNLSTSGSGNNADIAYAIRDSAGQSVERAGDKLIEHQLDVQPTITIRPGARVRVLVSRDLVFNPLTGS